MDRYIIFKVKSNCRFRKFKNPCVFFEFFIIIYFKYLALLIKCLFNSTIITTIYKYFNK